METPKVLINANSIVDGPEWCTFQPIRMVTNWSKQVVIKDQDQLEKITGSDLGHAKDQDQLSNFDLDLKDQWSFPISALW